MDCNNSLKRRRTSDLPTTVSRKYACANDLPIIHADANCQTVEGVLSKDMATVGEYLQTWKLKLSTKKAVLAVFHLNNKEAKRELKVNYNNETLPCCSEPTYLGVTLDRHSRTVVTSQKVDITLSTLETVFWPWLGRWSNNSANNHISPGPFNSKVLYYAHVWCRSARTCLIDPAINNALRTVTGCLRATPADNLLSSQASNLLSFVATEPHCLYYAVPWSLGICCTHRSLVHRVGMHGISNRDTRCTCSTTTHQF